MSKKNRPWVLYPRNRSAQLDRELLANPTAEYRGTPFWSWNSTLDITQLQRQIDQMKQMGFGGFHIHSRTGLTDEYLGEKFMQAVRACADKAAADSMLCWLYDEDRWPSGFAGGWVTRDPQYRAKHLLWTATPYRGAVAEPCQDERAAGTRSENGTLLARYHVVLKDGCLAKYRRLRDREKPPRTGQVWYAYLESSQPSSWFNNQTYVDTLSADAIKRFLETTHDKYAATVGDYFGTVVPSIFTDEPQFPKKTTFLLAEETRDVIMPFTTDFLDTYRQAYKQELLDYLPEIFWNLPGNKPSLARYRYHDHTAERFASGFGDTIAAWCDQHGIALTGHMLAEPHLHSQTRCVGEVMRGLRSFQLPGIDMLCDRMEYTTAKQAQSVTHQYGRPGVMSELYGVTNWDFDFVGHKRQGDWQAALGVTVRVPHLAWVSMAGESKRDYPAAIGYQSPWYKEYPLVENHFSRLNTVMTRGKPAVRVGVIHPVESFWLCFGPIEQNQLEQQEREEAFKNTTGWLLHGLIDFDYISESLLPAQCPKAKGSQLAVGDMKYDAVVVPSLRTIRSTTLHRLTKFARAGGTVIFAGEVPSLVDAKPSSAAQKLAKHCVTIPLTQRQLLAALEPFREVHIKEQDGSPADTILHQIRIDGKSRHIFFCNTDRDIAVPNAAIRIRGKWDVTQIDTFSGQTRPLHATIAGRDTLIPWSFSAHGHLLLTLSPGGKAGAAAPVAAKWIETARLADPVPVTLSEPNVLLLDQATWRLDDGPWQEMEEILRLDNKARLQLNLPMRAGRIAQPWTDTDPAPTVAQLQLKFTISSDVQVDSPSLAIEDAASVQIQLDGNTVQKDEGRRMKDEAQAASADSSFILHPSSLDWWVDESIKTVKLPPISPGEHELLLTIPFGRKTNVEWCYLLGDFGVEVDGRWAKLTAPIRSLAFGDWTRQSLAFYAGNVTYHCTVHGDGRDTLIEIPKMKTPLLSVNLDEKPAGKIAFAPYQLSLGKLEGSHKLDITAYGNRVNAFGAVHCANEKLTWFGPGAWRTAGEQWAYEYQLKRMGVLIAPIVKTSARE